MLSGEDLQHKQMKARDTRMKQMTEILPGMKVLKLYAWEWPFMERINQLRNKEISLLKIVDVNFESVLRDKNLKSYKNKNRHIRYN